MKKLHKRIMLSATYPTVFRDFRGAVQRLIRKTGSSRTRTGGVWILRSLRDSFIFAAGRLDLTEGGKAVDLFKAPYSTRRTVYGLIDRTNLPGTFRVFDMAGSGHP